MSSDPAETVGGQAVIEGVMMRAPSGWAVAVRTPTGQIEARSEELPRLSSRSKAAKIPFVRGVLVLGESLTLGMKALTWSGQMAAQEEEEGLGRWELIGSLTFAMILFAGVFMLGPALLADWISSSNSVMFAVVEGVIRILLFVLYIWAIGRMEDIKRVFQYHGAEHKTIHAYEAGDPLTIEEVQKYRPEHPRCGTSFLLVVLLGSVAVFAVVGVALEALDINTIPYIVASRIVFIPVIAGASYEFLRFSSLHAGGTLGKILIRPGLWLQYLTTGQPDEAQVEVAIASLLAALDEEKVAAVHARGPVASGALDVVMADEKE